MGQTNHNNGLTQLYEVYRHATTVLNNVKTVDEAGNAMKGWDPSKLTSSDMSAAFFVAAKDVAGLDAFTENKSFTVGGKSYSLPVAKGSASARLTC